MKAVEPTFESEVMTEFDSSFDQAVLEADAARTANTMLAQHIDSSLTPEHRFEAISALIDELSDDRGNQFIVLALGERLAHEKATLELRHDECFPFDN